MQKTEKSSREGRIFPLILAGLCGGGLCGFLGSGGGTVFVFALSRLLGREKQDAKDIFAMTVLTVLPLSVVCELLYRLLGVHQGPLFDPEQLPILLAALPGGLLGACLLDRIDSGWLKKLFGGILLVGGALMLLR